MNRWRIFTCSVLIAACFAGVHSAAVLAQEKSKKLFTAELETESWNFNPERFDFSSVHFSPDKKYFMVFCKRGRLDINRPEASLRFYRAADVEAFLGHSGQAQAPAPIWVVNRSTAKEGSNIEEYSYRWLPDSSGIAFLEGVGETNQRLMIADLKSKSVAPLTSEYETIRLFDVRDRNHYVYTAASLEAERNQRQADARAAMVVGTGRELGQLLLPENDVVKELFSHRIYHLWAVIGGARFEVKVNGAPIDSDTLALAPDGLSVVTTQQVADVPKGWETLYPPPPASSWRIHAGQGTANQYVQIELKTGSVQSLTSAPVGSDAGWFAAGEPAWSNDGKELMLPNTFIQQSDGKPSRPCIAVLDFPARTSSCVEMMKSRADQGFQMIWWIDLSSDGQQVIVKSGEDVATASTEYRRSPDGSWRIDRHVEGNQAIGDNGLEVTMKQSINDPPRLIASKAGVSRVIWDPNPQFQDVELSEATVYTWKDKDGHEVKGGLYKPVHYQKGQHYPLVIQTHGFAGTELFLPSGTGFPNEFAARQLAAAGFLVLQADDYARGCMAGNAEAEGPCAASNYEAAAQQLVTDGVADPDNIGLVGFSRSCWYVMEALTRTSYPFKAALIGDGITQSYMTFMSFPGPGGTSREIGAAPFGEGLKKWLEASPEFNLDKVKTPLMVVAHGPTSLFDVWEPYAGLYSLKKPVDLIVLKSNEHVITNPVQRVTSQTLSVDWFRFWLQGYEDPDPAKADQYKRWRELRVLQEEHEKKSSSTPGGSN